MIKNVIIGTDPEAFVQNQETGEIESAIGLIPGDKHFPFPITDKGHAIQTDNVMVEFCVPPSNDAKALWGDIRHCIDTIDTMLPNKLKVIVKASAYLDERFLNNEQAQTFGCDPDFSAYLLCQNQSPDSKTNLRSAGGHIHVGYNEPNFDDNISIVKALDLFLGIPSLILDKDTERRKMYGKAGAFREKSYGVEYRTLSNFWIESEESVTWMVSQVNNAIDFINKGIEISDVDQAKIQLAINNQDTELAQEIATKYNLSFSYKLVELSKMLILA